MLQLPPRTCSKMLDLAHCSLEAIMGMSVVTRVLKLSAVISAVPVSQLKPAVRGGAGRQGLLDSAGPLASLRAMPVDAAHHCSATGHIHDAIAMAPLGT
jgi:hypothetical protein